MTFDVGLGLFVAVLVLVYAVAALIRPETF
jgi:hypothetical protein